VPWFIDSLNENTWLLYPVSTLAVCTSTSAHAHYLNYEDTYLEGGRGSENPRIVLTRFISSRVTAALEHPSFGSSSLPVHSVHWIVKCSAVQFLADVAVRHPTNASCFPRYATLSSASPAGPSATSAWALAQDSRTKISAGLWHGLVNLSSAKWQVFHRVPTIKRSVQ
jgi:hypothetical protein